MDRDKAVEQAISQIEKQFGRGSIMKMGDQKAFDIPVISTGSLALDLALGIGGVPRGRVVEIFGPESSGKTTLALQIGAEAQAKAGMVAFVDAEHALDIGYARKLGVDVDSLLVSQPDTGEQALEIVESLIRSGAVDLVVVDSVAALTPRAEIEGDMGDSHMGLQARLMSQALRKLTAIISKSGCVLIFINQIRMKIGVMFGNPETTSGGNALKFYATIRIEIRRIETIVQVTDNAIGNKVRVKVVKNKVSPPYRKVEMEIMFGKGISASGSLLDGAVQNKIIEKSGSWYSFGEERIGQGRENAKTFLEGNPDVYAEVDKQVRAILFPKPANDEKKEDKPEKAAEKKARTRAAAPEATGEQDSEEGLF